MTWLSDICRSGLVVLVIAAVAACASLRPPLDVPERPPRQTADEDASPLELDIVEGRPNGLVLSFRHNQKLGNARWLELLRRKNDGRAKVFQRVALTDEIASALAEDGVSFVDRSLRPDDRVEYRLRLIADRNDPTPLAWSNTVGLTWEVPPSAGAVQAETVADSAIEVRWKQTGQNGALIFRRDVLSGAKKPARHAIVEADAAGLYVDRNVEPGHVYAYRIAISKRVNSALLFGRPSEPVYVSVPSKDERPDHSIEE